jgi:hypothetical protein
MEPGMATVQQLAIGVPVKYFPIMGNKEHFSVHVVRSGCWDVCGSTFVKGTSKAGGVCISHIELA